MATYDEDFTETIADATLSYEIWYTNFKPAIFYTETSTDPIIFYTEGGAKPVIFYDRAPYFYTEEPIPLPNDGKLSYHLKFITDTIFYETIPDGVLGYSTTYPA